MFDFYIVLPVLFPSCRTLPAAPATRKMEANSGSQTEAATLPRRQSTTLASTAAAPASAPRPSRTVAAARSASQALEDAAGL
jgi:hypothetical protein